MDNKAFIESGILETYALGMASAEDKAEVERRAREEPEIRTALREVQLSLEKLATAQALAPPAALRNHILGATTGQQTTTIGSPASSNRMGRKSSSRLLAIAAMVLLLLSLGLNLVQYNKLQRATDLLTETERRLGRMEQEKQVLTTNYQKIHNSLEVIHDTSNASFRMKSVEGRQPGLLATVLWNPQSKDVYLDITALPSPPAGKQYQLWAMKDGQPVDMGVFETGADTGLQQMGKIDSAEAFAVTLEPKGGSPKPSLEEMYVYGTPST